MAIFKKKGTKQTEKKAGDSLLTVNTAGMSEEEIAKLEAEAVLEKYDKESAYRNRLPMPLNRMISIILIAFSLFQLYTTIWTIPIQILRPMHLAFALLLVYLLYPAKRGLRKDQIPWYDWILAALAFACVMYLPLNYEYVIKNVGNFNAFDIAVGILGILLLMEACRPSL